MEGANGVAIAVAVIAAVASVLSAWAVRQKPKDPATAHVERVDKVVDIQGAEIDRLQEALDAAREREAQLLSDLSECSRSVIRLERELARFGV